MISFHHRATLSSSLLLSCSSALTFEYILLVSFGEEDAEAETISLGLLETGLTFALGFMDSCIRGDLEGWDFPDLVLLAVDSVGLRAPCFAKPLIGPVQDPVGVRRTLLLAC